jgi:hypothetical protein
MNNDQYLENLLASDVRDFNGLEVGYEEMYNYHD